MPVPRGRMATGGGGFKRSWSRVERIQPTWRGHGRRGQVRPARPRRRSRPAGERRGQLTVPSPPHARIRRLCTLRYISSLGWEDREGVRVYGTGPERQADPPHCPHRHGAGTYASLGPPWLRSKTCRGLRYQRNDWIILAPCEGRGRGSQGWWAEVGSRQGEGCGCGNQA